MRRESRRIHWVSRGGDASAAPAAPRSSSSVAEASSGQEAVAVVGELHPELVLLDVRMPGMDGIEATRLILAGHPSTVVVLISIEDIAGVPSPVPNIWRPSLRLLFLTGSQSSSCRRCFRSARS